MTETTSGCTRDACPTPEQLCAARAQRFLDAAQLKQPDRIPLLLRLGHLVAELAGVTRQELYENPEKAQAALVSAALRFQPDSISGLAGSPGPSRVLGDRSTKWPGYGLGPDGSFQYAEQDFMKPEDYDDFIDDPSDWSVRTLLPRVFSELEGLSALPPLALAALGFFGLVGNLPTLAEPEVAKALEALAQAARLQVQVVAQDKIAVAKLAAVGFPVFPFPGPYVAAPFDFMSDTLRGMRGIFTDLRRCPDKLLAAEEKASRVLLRSTLLSTRALRAAGGKAYAHFPLHRGSDEFMSIAQFERFYWPQLKALFLRLIENDITPFVFYEGIWDKRLQYLTELPKGKTIGYFHNTDIFRAKEVLRDTMCIMGGMPVSLLLAGTETEVRERTKQVCKACGQGGGFIMASAVGELEGCKPELVQTWVDATREFGGY